MRRCPFPRLPSRGPIEAPLFQGLERRAHPFHDYPVVAPLKRSWPPGNRAAIQSFPRLPSRGPIEAMCVGPGLALVPAFHDYPVVAPLKLSPALRQPNDPTALSTTTQSWPH